MLDFPINYVELEDGILDSVDAAGRDVPYSNFNFRVIDQTGSAAFDGKLLTAADLKTEQG